MTTSAAAKAAIVRAIQFLRAAGAYSLITDNELTIISDTFPPHLRARLCPPGGAVVPTVPVYRTRKRSSQSGYRDFAGKTAYGEKLAVLQPNETLTFLRRDYRILKEDDAWHSFCASVSSQARRRYGRDNIAIGNVMKKSISVLRIDPNAPFGAFENGASKIEALATGTRAPVKRAKPDTGQKPTPLVPKKQRRRNRRNFKDTGYSESIRKMKAGDELVWNRKDYESTAASAAAWISFAGTVRNLVNSIYPEHYVMEFKGAGGTLRVLRTADKVK